VLDRWLRPVPVGVPGELFLGGAGVARGYLGRQGATAERFLADPFACRPGARMFRTGDRARWRPDGRLEFLGRLDEQVKVRGHRVEPGEVEAALLAHPCVRQAAVAAMPDGDGGSRLDAFVVAGDPTLSSASLGGFLRDRLPRPMVPSTFTFLDALPLTPSGKVDRRALPPAERSSPAHDDARVVPRDELETRLAAVWEEVLDVRPIGVTDSFFDLGGHSLLAIRLLARVEEEFGRPLELPALFQGPTVEEMAALLRARPTGDRSPLVSIRPGGSSPPFVCVHPAGGIVYCFHELAERIGPDRPCYALQSPGLDDDRQPFASLEEMAACYAQAVRQRWPEGPYHLGGWSLGGLVAFEMARQLETSGGHVATLALLDTRAPSGAPPAVSKALRSVAEEAARLELLGPRDRVDVLDDALVIAELMGDAAVGPGARRLLAGLERLDPDARRSRLLRELGLDRVYALETGPERVGRLWRVLRANLLAAARYRPDAYPGRVTLFAASKGHRPSDPSMGWHRLARGGVTVHAVPGDHAGILKPPGVTTLARLLRAELDRDRGRP
jgi:thioesterase domain-containing protein